MPKKIKNVVAKKAAPIADLRTKILNKTISSFINTEYREFAFYTLENRGIPNFYDSLTNVQRTIIWNAPAERTKTMSLVGAVFASNYHHGDASIVNAINRMARPVLCADNILAGAGFFGTVVCPEASQPRYNKVNIKKRYNDLVKEYAYLNEIPQDDVMHRMYTSFPFGLVVGVNGIAIGYKSSILPRKFEDIASFIETGKGNLVPYFQQFTGTIKKMKLASGSKKSESKSVWLINGVMEEDELEKRIFIKDIPPVVSYTNYIKKLNKILDAYDVKIQNNSRDKVDIEITMNKYSSDEAYESLSEAVRKSLSVIFAESIVFSKDSQIVIYDSIENYLLDFKDELLSTKRKAYNYNIGISNFEINFLETKIKFLEYLQEKKRTESDINDFLQSYATKIVQRLKSIPAYKISSTEIANTNKELQLEKERLADMQKELKLIEKSIKSLTITSRSMTTSFEKSAVSDIDELEEVNGIAVMTDLNEIDIDYVETELTESEFSNN